MKVIHNILFTFAMIVGLTLSMSAQQKDPKKPTPPKQDPPVVNPAPKNPKPEKPKKPSSAIIVWKNYVGKVV
jgi:hypothetical protein